MKRPNMARTITQIREAARIAMAKKRTANPGADKEYQKKYRAENKDQIRVRERAYRETRRGHYRDLFRFYYETHREDRLKYNRQYKIRQRDAVFAFYGGSNPACECCGESHIEFLTIDHIDGGGNIHRKEIGSSALYGWLIKNNFPDGYRVLCMNCNWSIGIRGYCPHAKPGTGGTP